MIKQFPVAPLYLWELHLQVQSTTYQKYAKKKKTTSALTLYGHLSCPYFYTIQYDYLQSIYTVLGKVIQR